MTAASWSCLLSNRLTSSAVMYRSIAILVISFLCLYVREVDDALERAWQTLRADSWFQHESFEVRAFTARFGWRERPKTCTNESLKLEIRNCKSAMHVLSGPAMSSSCMQGMTPGMLMLLPSFLAPPEVQLPSCTSWRSLREASLAATCSLTLPGACCVVYVQGTGKPTLLGILNSRKLPHDNPMIALPSVRGIESRGQRTHSSSKQQQQYRTSSTSSAVRKLCAPSTQLSGSAPYYSCPQEMAPTRL